MDSKSVPFSSELNKILARYLGKVLSAKDCFVLRCVSHAFKELGELTLDYVRGMTLIHSLINNHDALRVLTGRLKNVRFLNCSIVESLPDQAFLDFTSGMRHLEHVNLNVFRVSNSALTPMLQASDYLNYICFSGCSWVSDEPLGVLARHQKKLQYIDLHGCDRVSKKALIELVVACTDVLQLIVGSIPAVDSEVMEAIRTNCPKLNHLIISDCQNVSDSDVKLFEKQRPGVKVQTYEFECWCGCEPPMPEPPPPETTCPL